jgi:hypothetical protein
MEVKRKTLGIQLGTTTYNILMVAPGRLTGRHPSPYISIYPPIRSINSHIHPSQLRNCLKTIICSSTLTLSIYLDQTLQTEGRENFLISRELPTKVRLQVPTFNVQANPGKKI